MLGLLGNVVVVDDIRGEGDDGGAEAGEHAAAGVSHGL